MELVKKTSAPGGACVTVDVSSIEREITEFDREIYLRVISTELTPAQEEMIANPTAKFPHQKNVLAVHWHPEFIPLELIRKRIEALYPGRKNELIIPTQHNVLMSWDSYSGVEVDCYSRGFNRKVQLLLHFREANLQGAETLRAMLSHTFRYRSSQLFEFMHSVTSPDFEERAQKAAAQTNADPDIVEFARIYTAKIIQLVEEYWNQTPTDMIKNKLVRNYFDALREIYDDLLINKVQVFLKAVKKLVKQKFSLKYFYRASEIIEEARSLGAGIVIPHPEQFWPILLAGYDVDGIEVWNPQSREYTEFLITTVNRQNKNFPGKRKLLVFMGDDCHMSEKIKEPEQQDKAKAAREVGLQPAWDDLSIRKALILSEASREKVMREYRERLG